MMTVLLWVLGIFSIYMTGFVVAGAIDERTCSLRLKNHEYYRYGNIKKCNHPFEHPFVIFWPLTAAFFAVVFPFWFVFSGAAKLSHKLASLPNKVERQAAREKKERRLEQERNTERKALRRKVHQLEEELGYKKSEFHSV